MSNMFVKKIVSISSFVAIIIAALIIIYYTTWIFAADKFIIQSESMMPTIIPGDKIVVNKLLFGARIYQSFFVPEDFVIGIATRVANSRDPKTHKIRWNRVLKKLK